MTINESIHSNKALENNQTNRTKQDNFSVLPYEIVLEIFSYLMSLGDLSRSMSVSKQWRHYGKDDSLWKKFDLKAIFSSKLGPVQDRSEFMWDILDLDSSQRTKLGDYKLFNLLNGCLNSKSKLSITNNAGVTVITMPKGMTLQKIMNFMNKNGMSVSRFHISGFWESIDNKPTSHTYTFVMTNDFVEKSGWTAHTSVDERLHELNSDLPTITEIIAYFATVSLSNPQKQSQGISAYRNGNFLHTFVKCDINNQPIIKNQSMMVRKEKNNEVHVRYLDLYNIQPGVGGVWRKDHSALPNQPS